jgi:hypothetical protein
MHWKNDGCTVGRWGMWMCESWNSFELFIGISQSCLCYTATIHAIRCSRRVLFANCCHSARQMHYRCTMGTARREWSGAGYRCLLWRLFDW